MSIPKFMPGKSKHSPIEKCVSTLQYLVDVWNALISSFKLYINYKLITQRLTGSRTLGTINLCAIVPARRLYGN
jgi:hypothetical protein